MSDLISSSEYAEIRSAIQDVKDTFFKLPVTVILYRTTKLTRFSEKKSNNLNPTSIAMTGLYVPSKSDDDSQAMQDRKGFSDISEGAIYLGYTECLATTPALIDGNGSPNIIPNKDELEFLGRKATIIGVNILGPDEAVFHLVKVHYKMDLAPSQ